MHTYYPWQPNMSKSSAGTVLCEPTELYNILTQGTQNPAYLEETYLTLFDARPIKDFYDDHIVLARIARNSKDAEPEFRIPVDVHLPTVSHCIVYDNKTVSLIEETPAIQFANTLATSGSRNPVMILKGGYERFSAEYPFLRTDKIMYSPRELQHLPHYPSEVMPLFLYLGEKRDACNAALNSDLKITTHVVLGGEISPTFPGKINSLHIKIRDDPEEELALSEICEFLESCWKRSERVLVYEESGSSRSAAAATAYLIKKNNLKLTEACDYVRKCRNHVLPLQTFLNQLSIWESQLTDRNS